MESSASKPSTLVKPTLDTKFHVDYDWWERSSEDLRIYLLSHLLPEQRESLMENQDDAVIDFIDPETGEVTQADSLQQAIRVAAKDENFINIHTSLVDSIFRVFLSNNNTPMSARELADVTGRSASVILKTLGSRTIYRGIRPLES